MFSLRRAAFRLLASPSPIARSRLKAVPSARHPINSQRTFIESRWLGDEGRSQLDPKDINPTPAPTPSSPTSTSTTAETSTTITTAATDDARGSAVEFQTEAIGKGAVKGDIADGVEADASHTTATETATAKDITPASEMEVEVETEGGQSQEGLEDSGSTDTAYSATTEKVQTYPSNAVEGERKTAQEVPGQYVGATHQKTTQSPENYSWGLGDIDVSDIRDAAADEIQAIKEARFREAQEAREEELDMLRKARYTPNDTVFIGNLFYDVTAEDLKMQMMKYGIVQGVNIIYDSRGISKGYGYVQFDSKESAKRAIGAMHMRIFEGRRVTLYYAQTRVARNFKVSEPTNTIYIGNLPFEMTDRDLQDLIKDIHGLIDVRVTVDRESGQLRGYIHAEFKDVQSSMIAFEKISTRTPYGRRLRVDFSNNVQSAQTGFPVTDGW